MAENQGENPRRTYRYCIPSSLAWILYGCCVGVGVYAFVNKALMLWTWNMNSLHHDSQGVTTEIIQKSLLFVMFTRTKPQKTCRTTVLIRPSHRFSICKKGIPITLDCAWLLAFTHDVRMFVILYPRSSGGCVPFKDSVYVFDVYVVIDGRLTCTLTGVGCQSLRS